MLKHGFTWCTTIKFHGFLRWPSYSRFNLDRGQAEKEFRIEVETIGRIRHKNLVLLLGYCVEGSKR
mgnify:FL=1